MPIRYIPRPPDEYYWYGHATPPSLSLIQALSDNVPFKPARWDQDYDDAGVWQIKSYPISFLFLPGTVPPIRPTFWKYNYDDYAYWVRDSYPIPVSRMPVQGGFPFRPRRWRRDYDEASLWTRKSYGLPLLDRQIFNTPLTPRRWVFDYDNSSADWQHAAAKKQIAVFGEYCQGYIIGI